MGKIRGTLSAEQNLSIAVEALREHQRVSELCENHGVPLSQLLLCKKQGMEGAESVSEQRTTNSIHD